MAPISASRDARQIAFALEVKSEEIFENIFLQNGVLAKMGLNKRVKIRRGGNKFDERIHLGQNSTVAPRSRFAQIPTDFQNTWFTGEYGQSVIDGTAVVNLVEIDQAQGEHRLDDVTEKAIQEVQRTFPNVVGDALMKTTPTSVDPESIVNRIEATAYGSQTSSLGGISRADHTGAGDATDAYQNQYNTTAVTDIGAATGISIITKFVWECSPGGSARSEQPDIGLTTTGVMAKCTGGQDMLRRYSVNDKMLKLGFDNILFNNMALIADRNVTAGYLYALNSNYLRLQILGGPNTKVVGDVMTVGDGKQTIPLQVRPAIESDNFLNIVIKVYLVMNLTFGGLRQHGLKTAITEA